MIEFVRNKYPDIENDAIKYYLYTAIGVYDNIIKSKLKEEKMLQLKKKYYMM